MKKQIFSLVALLLFLMVPLNGQEPNTTQGTGNMVNVFIDGNFIDINYLREEFPLVNYVVTPESSDLHILATRSNTAAGFKYDFYFYGSKQFAGKTDTLSYSTSAQQTLAESREGYTKVLKMGMMRYMAIANQIIDFDIQSNAPRGGSVVEKDIWNSWVFETDVRGNFTGQDTRKTQNYNAGFSATQVTPEWRHEVLLDYEYSTTTYTMGTEQRIKETVQSSADLLSVKSLGPHAGVGVLGHVGNDSFENYALNLRLAAAIEYNFFPYDMSSRRQLTVNYFFGYNVSHFIDTTVLVVLQEDPLYEQFSLGYSQREQWGSVSSSVTFKNNLRDFKENNLAVNASLNIRIWRGLSWSLSGSYSIVNDQTNLPLAPGDMEDILLGNRVMPTDKRYSLNTGISFTFGSMYNNVVNTRLRSMTGRGGGGMSGGGGNYGGGGGGF